MTVLWIVLGVLLLAVLLFLFLIRPRRRRDTSHLEGIAYAHRGYHAAPDIPENSLAAFRRAVESGYGVELDVQLTRDGQMVVFHDGSLLRMCGVDKRVCDLSYDELQAYSLGNTREKIPLFSQVMQVLGGVPLICEIKTYRSNTDLSVCEKVAPLLEQYPGPVCMESFNPLCVRWFKKHCPGMVRGQLSMDFSRDSGGQNPVVGFCLTHLLINVLGRPDFVAYCHLDTRAVGFRVCRKLFSPMLAAWTIRTPQEQQQAERIFDAVIFEGYPAPKGKADP